MLIAIPGVSSGRGPGEGGPCCNRPPAPVGTDGARRGCQAGRAFGKTPPCGCAAPARRGHWRRLSTAGNGNDGRRFRVTHPFHPLAGQEFELLGFAHTWGEQRVFFRGPGETRVRSLPSGWTDVEALDP